jgi:transcriptional regulator with XRE-family HTH domain
MANATQCQAAVYGKIHNVPAGSGSVDRARLVALRTARGWSINRLVREAGVDYSSYWRIEKGKAVNPRHETVQRLARALGVRTEDLSDPPDPAPPTNGSAAAAG